MSTTEPGISINIHVHRETAFSLAKHETTVDCERFVAVGIGFDVSLMLSHPDSCLELIEALLKAETFLRQPTAPQCELCDSRGELG